MQKDTAEANPMHSGIGFYPAELPFLLMSSPEMPLASMNYRTLGMSRTVRSQLRTPDPPISRALLQLS